MKKSMDFRSFAMIILTMMGCIAVNAKAIIPFGQLYKTAWDAKYFYAKSGGEAAPDDWYAADFDDSAWGTLTMPITSEDGLAYFNTIRPDERCRYWVRGHFTLSEVRDDQVYYIQYAHDDECSLYLNGTKLFDESGTANYNTYKLSANQVNLLKKGDNVLCMYVNDSGGGGMYLDFGLYEDEGDFQDIVASSDVQISFSNDATYPWTLNGSNAVNGNCGKSYSTSWLSMSFYSSKRVEVKFDWYMYNYSTHQALQVYIDGVLQNSTTNSSWNTPRFYLDAGEHVIAFRDSIGSNGNNNNTSGIKNIRIREIKPLETVVLTENSQPIQFVNEDKYPWTIEDGYIQNGNYGYNNTTSRISTTFTVEKTSKFSFLYRCMRADGNSGSSSYHQTKFKVNGIQFNYAENRTEFNNRMFIGLEPGTYTIEIVDSVWNTNTAYVSQLKDVELSNNWIEVELASAGTLGYEVLYCPGVNVLTDVEFLKIKGPMNAQDWTDIKNMTKLLAVDLSEAIISEIPNNAFDGKDFINSVILPERITRIGEYAFRGTNIRCINIPSTVTLISQYAFYGTPIQHVTFAENPQIETISVFAFAGCSSLQDVNFGNNTKLTKIDNAAFYNCKALHEVEIPNTVTSMGYAVFQDCTSLKSISFSEAITFINDHMCSGCSSLESIQLPQNLVRINYAAFNGTSSLKSITIPSTVKEIRGYAFQNSGLESISLPVSLEYLYSCAFNSCKSLKYIEMPSYLAAGDAGYYTRYYWASGSSISSDYGNEGGRYYGYYRNFINCTAIEKVVMRSATPPAISSDPFTSASAKSAITLVVPSFSVVNYKLDTYWLQFGTITEGDDVYYWKITSPLMLTNNRRMKGTPDVDLYYGGQFTVGGNAPFPMGQFNMYVNESDPGRLLNTCENMTADAVTTNFTVDANKWYFFTPLYDVALADIEVSNNASYVFRYYDAQNRAVNGASGSWKNVDTDKLLGGQGYIFHCNTACTITFRADANGQKVLFGTKDVTRLLTANEAESTANRSWNYVGNPYPCYYDIFYMDFTAPITVWNGSTYQAYSIADDDFVLRPMQSFFVQKPDAVDQIVFHKEGRQLTTDIVHAAGSRAVKASNRHVFNIQIENDEQNDMTRVVINNEASTDYELSCDAAKFMSFESSVPQIYTIDSDGNNYAINERPLDNGKVKLAYYAGQEGYYTISALRADGQVILYDAELNKTIDLTQEGYVFHSEATGGANSSRFTLTFKVGGSSTTSIEELSISDDQDADLYDLQGRKTTTAHKGLYIQNGKKVVRK